MALQARRQLYKPDAPRKVLPGGQSVRLLTPPEVAEFQAHITRVIERREYPYENPLRRSIEAIEFRVVPVTVTDQVSFEGHLDRALGRMRREIIESVSAPSRQSKP